MTKVLKVVFSVCGLVAFVFMVRAIGLTTIATDLRRTGIWFLAIIVLWGVVYLFNTGAWYFILDRKKKVRFARIFQVCVSGFALNNLTPLAGVGGEPYRAMVLKESIGGKDSLSAVVLYWMLHFLSSFVFWIFAIAIVALTMNLPVDIKLMFTITVVFSLAGTWFMMSRHKNGMFGTVFRIAGKISVLTSIAGKFGLTEQSVLLLDDGIKGLYNGRKKDFYSALSMEVIARVVASFEFIFILKAIGIEISFIQALYLSAGYSLFVNVFFFIPLQLGAREGGLYLLTGAIGIASGVGVFMALVMRIREILWTLVGLLMMNITGAPAKGHSMPDLLRDEELNAK